MSSPVFEIAILGRIAWNLHSLNNEGTVGNVTEPRTLVLADGTKTDGVSGEMLKHIHGQNVWLLAPDKSIFCEPCRTLKPQKADINPAVDEVSRKSRRDAAAVLDAALRDCALCDLHGFLRTKEAVPRSSTVEFGWAVAIRDRYHREVHTHARHAVEGRVAEAGEGEEVAAAQMVYHRPTRSGRYAILTVFAPWRIGLNEVTYQYVPGVDRRSRYSLVLEAYKAMFARTDGAMTSTRLPHPEDLEGIVAVSSRNFPVAVTSPLQDEYKQRLEDVQKVTPGLELNPFNTLKGLFEILENLKSRPLFTLEILPSAEPIRG